MSQKMPQVAQFSLPQLGQAGQQSQANQPPQSSRVGSMPSVATFSLPKNVANQQEQQLQTPEKHLGYLPTGNPSEVLGATYNTLVNPILHPVDNLLMPAAKFVKSAVAAPVDIVRGLMGQAPLDNNAGGLTTYQSDFAKNTVPAVESGQISPLQGTVQGVVPPVASGAGIIGAGELSGIGKVGLSEAASGNILGRGTAQEVGEALADRTATKEAANAVAPRLTPKVAEESATTQSGLMGRISRVPTQNEEDMAQAVKGVVKGKTFSEDKELVKGALGDEADKLQTTIDANNHPVPKRQAIAALRKAPVPDLIASDTTLQNAFNRTLNRAASIINDTDGTVSGIFKARKAFDRAVAEQYPNLYSSDTLTPMRGAIRNIRNAWNTFVQDQLPDEVANQTAASLRKQSLMYDAIDNLSEKAARGAPSVQGEIGTSRFSRFAANHPTTVGLLKKGGAVGASALAGGAGATAYEHITNR